MPVELKNILSNIELSRKDKVLVILFKTDEETRVRDIIELGVGSGLKEIKTWNVSSILGSLKGLAVKLPGGWAITEQGKRHIHDLGIVEEAPTQSIQPTLRTYVSEISSDEIRSFAEESVRALEIGLLRSAVVLSWVGAVAILYEEVVNNHLSHFNTEAQRRFPKWKKASNADGLSKMKEYDFLQTLHSLNIIGKNVKDELETCLKLRNACGHPNSLKVGEHKVASHVEILIQNVYSKYGI